jgi:hypothetical protein
VRVASQSLPALLKSKPIFASFAAFTRRPTEQPVEVQCFHTGKVRPAADPKREKRERRAARRARKVARQMVIQRRRERAAAAMAELDAEDTAGFVTCSSQDAEGRTKMSKRSGNTKAHAVAARADWCLLTVR